MENSTKVATGIATATAVGMIVGASMIFAPDTTPKPDFLPAPAMAEDYVPAVPINEEETITAQEVPATPVETTEVEQPKVTTESIGPLPGEVEEQAEPKPTFTERVKKTFRRFLPKKKEVETAEPRAKKIRKEASVRYAKRKRAQASSKDSLPLNGAAPNGVFAWELDRQLWTYRNPKNRNKRY